MIELETMHTLKEHRSFTHEAQLNALGVTL